MKPIAAVIIPTFNEAENISLLIDELCLKIFPTIFNWDMRIVVVDGDSSDGTADIVREQITRHHNVFLVPEEKKGGIGAAYMKGFAYTVNDMRADAVIEFDADFQHPPEIIRVLLNKIDQGYDYVLGSRMIPGGGESAGRSFMRVMLTKLGGRVARCILFFPGKYYKLVTDPTTGLKATRVHGCLDKLNLNEECLYSKKFGYKIQLLSETLATGARYAEVPLRFNDRTAGISKFEFGTAADILVVCFRTRFHYLVTRRFLRFAVVGAIGYVVNAVALIVWARFISIEALIWVLATETAVISNFILNDLWTFRDRRMKGTVAYFRKFFQFNLSSAGALIIQTILGTVGVVLFGAQHREMLLPVIIIVAVLPYNWYMYRHFIWDSR